MMFTGEDHVANFVFSAGVVIRLAPVRFLPLLRIAE